MTLYHDMNAAELIGVISNLEADNAALQKRGKELERVIPHARALLDACLLADAHEDLTHWVDGSHMDALANAMEATYPVVFTDEEVAQLVEWQVNPRVHPLTCGGDRSDLSHCTYAEENDEDMGQLIPTPRGLLCPVCDYRQVHFPLKAKEPTQ